MKQFYDLASIHMTAERCKSEGIPISEKSLRHFVRNSTIPAVMCNSKVLIYWSNIIKLVENGSNLNQKQI